MQAGDTMMDWSVGIFTNLDGSFKAEIRANVPVSVEYKNWSTYV